MCSKEYHRLIHSRILLSASPFEHDYSQLYLKTVRSRLELFEISVHSFLVIIFFVIFSGIFMRFGFTHETPHRNNGSALPIMGAYRCTNMLLPLTVTSPCHPIYGRQYIVNENTVIEELHHWFGWRARRIDSKCSGCYSEAPSQAWEGSLLAKRFRGTDSTWASNPALDLIKSAQCKWSHRWIDTSRIFRHILRPNLAHLAVWWHAATRKIPGIWFQLCYGWIPGCLDSVWAWNKGPCIGGTCIEKYEAQRKRASSLRCNRGRTGLGSIHEYHNRHWR